MIAWLCKEATDADVVIVVVGLLVGIATVSAVGIALIKHAYGDFDD